MKRHEAVSLFSGAASVLCVASAIAFAPSGGRVTFTDGPVDIMREQATLPAERGSTIKAGDQLRTATGGRLQWWMNDDSMIAQASSSQASIRDFAPEVGEAVYWLKSGGLRVVSGTTHPKVLTPRATVQALGTDFITVVCDRRCGTAAGEVYVLVRTGSVRVRNADGGIDLSAGQAARVASAPTAVAEVPPPVLEIAMELEFEGNIDGVNPDALIQPLPLQPIPPVDPPGSPS